jgi:hypothetical protein
MRNTPPSTLRAEDKDYNEHLERKRYWETKARDAREEFDDLANINFDVVRPRTPVATFASEKKTFRRSSITFSSLLEEFKQGKGVDDRQEISSSTKRNTATGIQGRPASKLTHAKSSHSSLAFLAEIAELLGEDEHSKSEPLKSINYTGVEKKVVCGVSMARQEQVRQSLVTRVKQKPSLQRALAANNRSVSATRRYYGPQLQVPWGEDRLPPRATDQDGSPFDLIADIFPQDVKMAESETAIAFLKSSLVGRKRGSFSFTGMSHVPREKRLDAAFSRNYIKPVDWKEKLDRQINHTLNMDLHRGRDVVKVIGKDQRRLIAFDEVDLNSERLGPGEYSSDKGFGADAKGVVSFSKLSESLSDDRVEVEGECLDLEPMLAHTAVQKNDVRNITLYRQVSLAQLLWLFVYNIDD